MAFESVVTETMPRAGLAISRSRASALATCLATESRVANANALLAETIVVALLRA